MGYCGCEEPLYLKYMPYNHGEGGNNWTVIRDSQMFLVGWCKGVKGFGTKI